MARITFGHCIGCDQHVRPPFLSFVVSLNHGADGNSITSWEEVDVCADCAGKLTADDLHGMVQRQAEDEAEAEAEARA